MSFFLRLCPAPSLPCFILKKKGVLGIPGCFFFFSYYKTNRLLEEVGICEKFTLVLQKLRQGNIAACKAFQLEGRLATVLVTSQLPFLLLDTEPAGGAETSQGSLRDNGSRGSG